MTDELSFLYIEDDAFSRQVVHMLITRVLGYSNITIFEDSNSFVTRLNELSYKPDVIFVDIQMAPHDGYAVLKMLREHPDYKEATVVAMTANVMATDIDKLKRTGFDGLIGKPIDRKLFPELVKKILSGESVWFVT